MRFPHRFRRQKEVPGHDLVLDPAGPAPLRLRPSALEHITVVEVTEGGPR